TGRAGVDGTRFCWSGAATSVPAVTLPDALTGRCAPDGLRVAPDASRARTASGVALGTAESAPATRPVVARRERVRVNMDCLLVALRLHRAEGVDVRPRLGTSGHPDDEHRAPLR